MRSILASQIFLTRGSGQHREKLVSFEIALREAGISPFNLVRVSSIVPPRCRLISRDEGLKRLTAGQIVFLVMSENTTDEAHRLISASIGMAVPKDPKLYGYLAEHESFGQSEKESGQYAEDLAVEMLATKLGGTLVSPSGRRKGRESKALPTLTSMKTKSLTQTATGRTGLWTTVLAAAILVT